MRISFLRSLIALKPQSRSTATAAAVGAAASPRGQSSQHRSSALRFFHNSSVTRSTGVVWSGASVRAAEVKYKSTTEVFDCTIDVREQNEWDAGHIEGAMLLPLSLLTTIDNVASDAIPAALSSVLSTLRSRKSIVVYCRAGARSERAALILAQHGIQSTNMKGGFMEYEQPGW